MKRIPAKAFLIFLLAVGAWAQGAPSGALGSDGWMSLLTAGVSDARLVRLAKERGVSFRVSDDCAKKLQAAGATPVLIAALRSEEMNSAPAACGVEYARAAASARKGDYRDAERVLREIAVRRK